VVCCSEALRWLVHNSLAPVCIDSRRDILLAASVIGRLFLLANNYQERI